MLQFTRKFSFAPSVFDQVIPLTLGCTFWPDGSFEAATDEDLSDQGLAQPISQTVSFRVTAKTESDLNYWVGRLLKAVGGGKVFYQVGYWHPTQERETSVLIETNLAYLPEDFLDEVYAWMAAADQQAVYIEYGGVVYIAERDELPELEALLAAVAVAAD
jgi:hypothetical protein